MNHYDVQYYRDQASNKVHLKGLTGADSAFSNTVSGCLSFLSNGKLRLTKHTEHYEKKKSLPATLFLHFCKFGINISTQFQWLLLRINNSVKKS